jgi:putative transposase
MRGWRILRVQRWWVHKTANVLNKLPKHLQPKAKSDLHQIWMTDTRENARLAFDLFVQT